METHASGGHPANRSDIVVQVRYLAAGHPFTDSHASETETLASVKQRALLHFGLVEGGVEGGSKQYSLSKDGELLTNQAMTLGELAGGDHKVTLTLLEQFIQG